MKGKNILGERLKKQWEKDKKKKKAKWKQKSKR